MQTLIMRVMSAGEGAGTTSGLPSRKARKASTAAALTSRSRCSSKPPVSLSSRPLPRAGKYGSLSHFRHRSPGKAPSAEVARIRRRRLAEIVIGDAADWVQFGIEHDHWTATHEVMAGRTQPEHEIADDDAQIWPTI